ncbi:MAG: uracil-DNA glycosylase [Bacteroidota bacterium]|nr:uracil-DNA glycosylase [Bacteroidota bacterium]
METDNEFIKLKAIVENCNKCKLSETRNNVVFGNGNPNADIFIVGEGPGYYEDKIGKAFVGKSGKLLDKILEACGFTREKHVFIGNIVKCRPPQNRNPLPEEHDACIPYLYKQIELVNPKIIILLGASALKGLIDPNLRITKVRGNWINWNDIYVMPTFHPAALLRNNNLKRDVWEDFKKIVAKYRELVDEKHFSKHC